MKQVKFVDRSYSNFSFTINTTIKSLTLDGFEVIDIKPVNEDRVMIIYEKPYYV